MMKPRRTCGLLFVLTTLACGERPIEIGEWLRPGGNPGTGGSMMGTPANVGGSPGMPMGSGGGVVTGGKPMGMGGAGGATMQPMMPPPMPSSNCSIVLAPMPVRGLPIRPDEGIRRLARLLFRSEPDPMLMAQAMRLQRSNSMAEVARDMLADPRAQVGLDALTQAWLGTDEIATATALGPTATIVTPDLRRTMQAETERFVRELISDPAGGNLRQLLTANFTWADMRTSRLYGVPDVLTPELVRITLDPQQRSGVLTHLGTLFARPYAPSRGAWLSKVFSCMEIPLPPPDVDRSLPVKPGMTTRQVVEQQTASPQCRACHALMDGYGFALEHYDQGGRYRVTDNGLMVNASTVLPSPPDLAGQAVTGAPDLGHRLAGSCEVQLCTARTFVGHAIQTTLATFLRQEDEGAVAEVAAAFAASGFDLKELLLAVVQSPLFLRP